MGMAHGYPEACGYLNGYGIHCYVWVTLMPVAAVRRGYISECGYIDASGYIDKCGLH